MKSTNRVDHNALELKSIAHPTLDVEAQHGARAGLLRRKADRVCARRQIESCKVAIIDREANSNLGRSSQVSEIQNQVVQASKMQLEPGSCPPRRSGLIPTAVIMNQVIRLRDSLSGPHSECSRGDE